MRDGQFHQLKRTGGFPVRCISRFASRIGTGLNAFVEWSRDSGSFEKGASLTLYLRTSLDTYMRKSFGFPSSSNLTSWTIPLLDSGYCSMMFNHHALIFQDMGKPVARFSFAQTKNVPDR